MRTTFGWESVGISRTGRVAHATRLIPLENANVETVETGGGDRPNRVEDRFKFSKRRDKVEFDGV